MLNLEFDKHHHRPEWPNGNYLSALKAHPGGPKGQPDTTAGSKPIAMTGLPKRVRSPSHCTLLFLVMLAHRAPPPRRALPGA